MKDYVPLGLEYLVEKEESGFEESSESEDFLDSIISDKSRFLQDSISQLEKFREDRRKISNDFKQSTEYSLMYLSMDISKLDLWNGENNPGAEKRRTHLEKQSAHIEEARFQEEKDLWSDELTITRDLHSLLKEYLDLQIRKKIVQDE